MQNLSEMTRKIARLTAKVSSLEKQVSALGEKDPKWIDTQDVCLRLHVTKRTLANYRKQGILPFMRIGGKYFYKMEGNEMYNRSTNRKGQRA